MSCLPLAAWVVLVAALGVSAQDTNEPAPLTLSLLGRPTAEKPEPARKINELFLHEGKLYLGHGDYSANTGATEVIAYDLKGKTFATEFRADDEAIVRYRVLNGKLVIPGIDGTEDWSFGNIYLREKNGWEKRRTVPHGVHVFDAAALGDWWLVTAGIVLKVGENQEIACGAIFASPDEGRSWHLQYTTPASRTMVYRVESLLLYKRWMFAFPYAFAGVPDPQNKGQTKYVRVSDPMGAADSLVLLGENWRPIDLVPEPGVRSIVPVVVREDMVLIVGQVVGEGAAGAATGGGEGSRGRDDDGNVQPDATGDGQGAGSANSGHVRYNLWRYDGARSHKLHADFDDFRDAVAREGELSLLVKQGDRHFIVVTADLNDWRWLALPPQPAAPMSLEFDGEKYFIGYEDGAIMTAAAAR